MSTVNSYKQMLRSSGIIGGASVINILVGLLRIKFAAMWLGPTGVGLIGLMQTLLASGSTVAALGFGTVGTRQIAAATGEANAAAVATARRALLWGTLGLATVGGSVFWGMRGILAERVLGDANLSGAVGWLALGVALTVASGSQGALLTGLRRIGDVARISVLSASLSAVLGIGALWAWDERGVLVFVLAAPLASFVFGHWYVSRLPRIQAPRTPLVELVGQWKTLAKLGSAFMVAGLAVTGGQLAVRVLIERQLGMEALGQFQAAWIISMTYIGFVLTAMGADFYPRLAAVIKDSAAANRLVNEQTEVALLLAGPVFIAMIGLAPWVIQLLYTSEFSEAALVLRWQVLGDILKVASWPLGFVLLAANAGRTYLLAEVFAVVVFVSLSWIGTPMLGLEASGIAFLGMYVAYLPVVLLLAQSRTGFSWRWRVAWQLALLMGSAVAVLIASHWSPWLGASLGVAGAAMWGVHALARLGGMANLDGRLGRLATVARVLMERAGVRRDWAISIPFASGGPSTFETSEASLAGDGADSTFPERVNSASRVKKNYLIIWPDMDKEGGVQVLVKEMTDILLREHCVAVACDPGLYAKNIHPRAKVVDLKGRYDLSEAKRWLEGSRAHEVIIIGFNATTAALAEVLLDHAAQCNIPGKVIIGVYHPRAFLENSRLSPLGIVSRILARSLGAGSIYFMNEECRDSHSLALSSSFSKSSVILLPVINRGKRWHTRNNSGDELRVVSIGRITAFKAYNFASRKIVERLASNDIRVVWDIYGWGEDETSLHDQLKGQESVRFLGRLDDASFEDIVVKYDLFVGMGMSAIRAAQTGIPTILAMESNGDSCLGYSCQAPRGNVGEVPQDANLVKDLGGLIESHHSLAAEDVLSISRDCSRWSEQFEYRHFAADLNQSIARSHVKSRTLYVAASRTLLLLLTAKRTLRSSFDTTGGLP